MGKKKIFFGISIILSSFTILMFQSNCCTIIHGTTQEIAVNSQPSGAKVIVRGVHMATTPAVIELDRKNSNIVLSFEKEGYEKVEIALKRGTDAWIVGNIIFGGVIGLIVDFSNGAAYELSPDTIQVELNKLNMNLDELPKDGIVIAVDLQSLEKEKDSKKDKNVTEIPTI